MDFNVFLNPIFLIFVIGGVVLLSVGIWAVWQITTISHLLKKYPRKIRFFYLFTPSRWAPDIDAPDMPLLKKGRRIELGTMILFLVVIAIQAALIQFFLCKELDVAVTRELLLQPPVNLGVGEQMMLKTCI